MILRKTCGGCHTHTPHTLTAAILVRSVSTVGMSIAAQRSGQTFTAVTGKLLLGALGGLGLLCGAERSTAEKHTLAVKGTRSPKLPHGPNAHRSPARPTCRGNPADGRRRIRGRCTPRSGKRIRPPCRAGSLGRLEERLGLGGGCDLAGGQGDGKTQRPECLSCLFVKPPAFVAQPFLPH